MLELLKTIFNLILVTFPKYGIYPVLKSIKSDSIQIYKTIFILDGFSPKYWKYHHCITKGNVIYLPINGFIKLHSLTNLMMTNQSSLFIQKSGFSEEEQYVSYKGVKSKFYLASSGVPQKHNISLLLFLLFINDLPILQL